MDVRLEDGTIVKNVPEGTTKSEILRRLGRKDQSGFPNQFIADPRGIGEAALHFGTAGLASIPAGLAGIGAAVIPGGKPAADIVESVQNALTYQPRTAQGQAVTAGVDKPLQAYEKFADVVGEKSGNPNQVLGATAVKTAILGAPALLGLRSMKGSTKGPLSTRQQVFEKASQEGYVADPAAVNPKRSTGILEGASGKLKTQQLASVKNQQVTNSLANRALGLPEDTLITRESLKAVRDEAGQAYEGLRGRMILGDTKFRSDLSKATSEIRNASRDFPETMKGTNKIVRIAEDVNKPHFDSGAAIDALKFIRDKTSEAYRAGKSAEGNAYRGISKALEDAIERDLVRQGASDLVDNFKASRERIAKSYSVENALEGSDVSAPKLAAQLRRGKPLSGELKIIAEFADQFPKITRTMRESVPQLSPLDIWTSLASMGGSIATGNPALLAPAVYSLARPGLRSLALGSVGKKMALSPPVVPGVMGPAVSGGLLSGQAR